MWNVRIYNIEAFLMIVTIIIIISLKASSV